MDNFNDTIIVLTESLGATGDIIHVDMEEDWELIEQADEVFKKVGIYYGRDKDVTLVLVSDDNVVGALASHWYLDDNAGEPAATFSFDIAVLKDFRGGGLKLLQDGIDMFEGERYEMEAAYGVDKSQIINWTVNPRLYDIMVRRYGFQKYGPEHLVRY